MARCTGFPTYRYWEGRRRRKSLRRQEPRMFGEVHVRARQGHELARRLEAPLRRVGSSATSRGDGRTARHQPNSTPLVVQNPPPRRGAAPDRDTWITRVTPSPPRTSPSRTALAITLIGSSRTLRCSGLSVLLKPRRRAPRRATTRQGLRHCHETATAILAHHGSALFFPARHRRSELLTLRLRRGKERPN